MRVGEIRAVTPEQSYFFFADIKKGAYVGRVPARVPIDSSPAALGGTGDARSTTREIENREAWCATRRAGVKAGSFVRHGLVAQSDK